MDRLSDVASFTLLDLQEIAREVLDDGDIVLSPAMNVNDVPGWDSLNHTLITLEIAGRFNAKVEAPQLGRLPTFGDLVAFVNANIARPDA
jgi:acyl carrier protein